MNVPDSLCAPPALQASSPIAALHSSRTRRACALAPTGPFEADDVARTQRRPDPCRVLLGTSEAVQELRRLIGRVARSPTATVLLTGETGTGKGLAARVLHDCSDRATGPFVNVTCTALPTALLESELFGHERGAFTDAKVRHLGLFEQAGGGTLFLDEIGDMDASLQAKLLRVLEEKRFRRVGGTQDLVADVRFVAATNLDLLAAVAAGTFREDLYYRLAVIAVPVPRLRDRVEDIEPLAEAFLASAQAESGQTRLRLSRTALEVMQAHHWPGNVRELRNVIQRAVVMTDGAEIEASDLPDFATDTCIELTLPAGGLDVAALERSLVMQAMDRTHGNATAAAHLLGMNRDQVRYRIQKYRDETAAP